RPERPHPRVALEAPALEVAGVDLGIRDPLRRALAIAVRHLHQRHEHTRRPPSTGAPAYRAARGARTARRLSLTEVRMRAPLFLASLASCLFMCAGCGGPADLGGSCDPANEGSCAEGLVCAPDESDANVC